MARQIKILILGGGFGGLYTALELERALGKSPDVEITLVNRDNFFLFTPMLHEVAASDLDLTAIVNPIRKLLTANRKEAQGNPRLTLDLVFSKDLVRFMPRADGARTAPNETSIVTNLRRQPPDASASGKSMGR